MSKHIPKKTSALAWLPKKKDFLCLPLETTCGVIFTGSPLPHLFLIPQPSTIWSLLLAEEV